jgi:flagellum-specific ATP synthase
VLSRSLADQGHYPAIDIEASISRAMNELVSVEEFALVRRFKYYYSRYQRSRDLISVGAYVRGGDRELDEAVARYPDLERFLQQGQYERADYAQSRGSLAALFPA